MGGSERCKQRVTGSKRSFVSLCTTKQKNNAHVHSDGTLNFKSMQIGGYYAVKYEGANEPETFIFAGFDQRDGKPIQIRVR